MTRRLLDGSVRLAALLVVGALWLLATQAADSIFFPSPADIIPATWTDWLSDAATWETSIIPSIVRLLYGYFLAAVASILLGLVIGRSQFASEFLEPSIHFLRAIPPPALLPLFLIILGIGDLQKVVLIAVGVAPPILLNTIEGVRAVERLQLETAAAYQISRWDRLTRVILPAAAPKIFAGLRVSMSLAVILMVISELSAATDGLGFRINQAARNFAYLDMWAGLVVLGLLGIVLNLALTLVESRVLRWSNS